MKAIGFYCEFSHALADSALLTGDFTAEGHWRRNGDHPHWRCGKADALVYNVDEEKQVKEAT
ncbi:MAG: hypothetical protein U0990_00960 [Candidatus Nanopelagicales bacterium]|nr:hypothetical protein [Candidatus Nanopelagicales bacterium]